MPYLFVKQNNLHMIIGIGGVSRSGKTSLSRALKAQLRPTTIIVHLDDYIKESRHWDFFTKNPIFYLSKVHKKFDMEHPDTIDFDAFHRDIVRAAEEYDTVIAEGFLIVYDPRIKKLIDKYVHVEVSKSEFIKRRIKDFRHSNLWYAKHVWKSFVKYGNNYAGLKHMVVNGDVEIDVSAVLKFVTINQDSGLITSS